MGCEWERGMEIPGYLFRERHVGWHSIHRVKGYIWHKMLPRGASKPVTLPIMYLNPWPWHDLKGANAFLGDWITISMLHILFGNKLLLCFLTGSWSGHIQKSLMQYSWVTPVVHAVSSGGARRLVAIKSGSSHPFAGTCNYKVNADCSVMALVLYNPLLF